MDISEAARDDDITKSLDYTSICKEISDFLKKNTFKLIETIADRLAKYLLIKHDNLNEVSIKIKKPWAPILMTLDTVSVSVSRNGIRYIWVLVRIWEIEKIILKSNRSFR